MSCAGKVEVKLRQSEIELVEQKMEQKQMEIKFLTDKLQQLEKKIQKLEQHLRNQKKTGDGTDSESSYAYAYQLECDELELVRLRTEGLSTVTSLSTADLQKHQLQCEKKMQNQEILSIQKALSANMVESTEKHSCLQNYCMVSCSHF